MGNNLLNMEKLAYMENRVGRRLFYKAVYAKRCDECDERFDKEQKVIRGNKILCNKCIWKNYFG